MEQFVETDTFRHSNSQFILIQSTIISLDPNQIYMIYTCIRLCGQSKSGTTKKNSRSQYTSIIHEHLWSPEPLILISSLQLADFSSKLPRWTVPTCSNSPQKEQCLAQYRKVHVLPVHEPVSTSSSWLLGSFCIVYSVNTDSITYLTL